MPPARDKLREFSLRLVLWSAPLALAAGLLLATRQVEGRAVLAEVGARLVAGDDRAAKELLATVRAPLAAAVADILGGGEPEPGAAAERGPPPAVDPAVLPLALISRTAFEQGDFRAALRIAELAGGLGLPTVPVVAAAALIEDGRSAEARALVPPGPAPPGRLARRVVEHLTSRREHRGPLLRDRGGRPIGVVEGTASGGAPAGGELRLFDGVAPELVPRAVAEAVSGLTPAAGVRSGSLRLSLDLELAAAARAALGERHRGSIVLVDVRSGGILAAVSDRRSIAAAGTPAFEQLREPASIVKLITTTAALRAGLDPDAELARMRCRGEQRYDGKILYCPHVAGPLRGLDRALAVSCNVAFADLGVRVGWRGMLAELLRFGFEAPLGPFPGGRILTAFGDDRRLADLAIGLEVTAITPLHAALVAAVVANGGVMPEPTLVSFEDGRLGLHPRPVAAAGGRRVIDRRWADELLGAMEVVVERGTARRVAPPGFPVAMKTGTASDPRHGFHVNYIGVGPLPAPWLAFCVRITDRPSSRKVRAAAREVTWRLLRSLGRISGERGWIDAPPRPLSYPERIAAEALPADIAKTGAAWTVGRPEWPSGLTAR